MVALFVYLFCVIVALAVGALAGWSDFQGLKIPNIYPLVIAGLFVPAIVAAHLAGVEIFAGFKSHILAAGFVFVLTFALYSFGLFGGGDSKLLTSFALWTGFSALPVLLVYMALFGGFVGGVAVYIQKRKPFTQPPETSWIGQVQAGQSKVPYGVAIVLGAIIAFVQTGYFAPQSLEMFLGGS